MGGRRPFMFQTHTIHVSNSNSPLMNHLYIYTAFFHYLFPLPTNSMETLTSSAFKAIVVSTHRPTSFSIRTTDNILLLPAADRTNNVLLLLRQKRRPVGLLPISASSRFSSSDHLQMNFHDEHFEVQGRIMATVHVRFQLQRECLFGEQFYLVGDSPMIGCWNTQIAVPLEWSEGHVWTIDMDIPIDETIQYKFILKGESSKDVIWQPGSDRILNTWKTSNKIVVYEDWDDSLLQKVIEEEPVYVHQISSTLNSDNLSFEDEMKLANAMTSISSTMEKKKDEEIFESNLNSLRKRFAMHEGGSNFESNGIVAAVNNNNSEADDADQEQQHEDDQPAETEPSFVANASSYGSGDLVDEVKA